MKTRYKKQKRFALGELPPYADNYDLPRRPDRSYRVWFDNYFDFVDAFPIDELPANLQNDHATFMQSTKGGESLREYYRSDQMQRRVNDYFRRLNNYLNENYNVSLSGATQKRKSKKMNDQEFFEELGATRKRGRPKKKQQREYDEDDEEQEERAPRKQYKYKDVETISETVRFIRRFANMNEREVKLERLASFIRSLKRAIVNRTITKRSAHAREIAEVQDLAIKAYNKAQGNRVTIRLNDDTFERLYAVGKGEKVRGSVSILKRFVSLIGMKYGRDLKRRIEGVLKSLAHLVKRGILQKNDPYYDRVKQAEQTMRAALRTGNAVRVAPSTLNGLNGIIEDETGTDGFFDQGASDLNGFDTVDQQIAQPYNDEPKAAAVRAYMSAPEMDKRKEKRMNFSGYYEKLLDKPATDFFMVVYGPPWNGKSTFLVGFAKYLAENFGRVLYVWPEQYNSDAARDLSRWLGANTVEQLTFARSFADVPDLSSYDFFIIDSVTAMPLNPAQVQAIRERFAGKAIIASAQSNKRGAIYGEARWNFDTDIVMRVENKTATIEKNRFTREEPPTLPLPLPGKGAEG